MRKVMSSRLRPMSVTSIRRRRRSNRRTPKRSSSVRTWPDKVGWVTLSSWAALVKLPSVATA